MADICGKIQQLGKGIASPSRYKIIEVLIGGPQTVTALVDELKISQPAVSQHLSALKRFGLVQSSKHGQEVVYSLNASYMLELLKHLTSGVAKCPKAHAHGSKA